MSANNYKLVTNNFKSYSVNQFIESLTEPANTIFYMFAGKHTPYEGGDSQIDVPNNSIQSTYVNVYDNMLFGKQITENDIKTMVPRYDWSSNTIYTQYDHEDGLLYTKNYYVVTTSGTNRYVFKCLYNANGVPSTSEPDFNETGADDILYETADGYQWKYLYTIDQTTWNKFSTSDYIPLIPDANVTSNSVSGCIDVILVESSGTGYNNYFSGQFGTTDTSVGGNTITFNLGSSASSANDYYTGSVIVITEGTGKGQYRRINSYTVVSNTKQITVNSSFTTALDATSQYEISPYVQIIGNGTQTINCEARALINSASSNSIYKIEVLNRGANYLSASANVIVSNVISISSPASLKVILPPPGGHGSNIQNELNGTRLGISVSFSNTESDTIVANNDYRMIGILKDPKFANIGLTVSNVSGSFSTNEYVYQVRRIKLDGVVSINTTSNVITSNTLNLEETFKQNDYVYIVSGDGQEVTNIIVADGGSSYETGERLTFTGSSGSNAAGYVVTVNGAITNVKFDSIKTLQITGSEITGVVTSVSVSSGGFGFTNGEVVTITGDSSGSSNATGTAITTGGGSLDQVEIVDGGSAYINEEFVQINSACSACSATATVLTSNVSGTSSGSGFTNDEIVTITGLTSTALNSSGLAVTDGTGSLTNVIFTDSGSGYTNNESVTIASSCSTVNATASILTTYGGNTFSNAQILTIKGSNSGVNVASGLATTNSTGGLVSIDLIDGAYNYVQNEILEISSSTSTVNATASVETANGSIRSVILSNLGYGYTTEPVVGIDTVSGSGASLTAVINTAPISTNRILSQVGTVTNSSQISITSNGTFTSTSALIYLANVSSYGIVDSFSVNQLFLQNSVGFFTTGSLIVGNTSLATANIDSIQISNTSKPYTTFLQSIRYEGASISGVFEEDEQIKQSLEGLEVANAYLLTSNNITNTLYATQQQGNFLIANTIIGNSSGAEMVINNIYKGDIIPWSGEVVYLQNIEPISRADDQTETIKIILEL